jgi:hypothetical protein
MAFGIGEGIAAAKLAFDAGAKALDESRRPNFEPDKLRTHLTAMQDHILSAQRALNEAEDENRQLRRQIEDMERVRDIHADMEFQNDGGFYIRKSERDAGNPVAYCSACYGDSKGTKLIPLRPTGDEGAYHCIIHTTLFKTKARLKDQKEQMTRMSIDNSRGGGPWS